MSWIANQTPLYLVKERSRAFQRHLTELSTHSWSKMTSTNVKMAESSFRTIFVQRGKVNLIRHTPRWCSSRHSDLNTLLFESRGSSLWAHLQLQAQSTVSANHTTTWPNHEIHEFKHHTNTLIKLITSTDWSHVAMMRAMIQNHHQLDDVLV